MTAKAVNYLMFRTRIKFYCLFDCYDCWPSRGAAPCCHLLRVCSGPISSSILDPVCGTQTQCHTLCHTRPRVHFSVGGGNKWRQVKHGHELTQCLFLSRHSRLISVGCWMLALICTTQHNVIMLEVVERVKRKVHRKGHLGQCSFSVNDHVLWTF